MLTDLSLAEFTARLAAKEPVPGGGGAAALAGALAAGLGSMVGAYTLGKPKYAAQEDSIRTAMAECATLRTELLHLVEQDAEAFAPLSQAYALPKDAPGRAETLEACLHTAAEAPLAIARLAARTIELAALFAAQGSTLMASDAACAAALGRAALDCAAINVLVNTRLMRDLSHAASLEKELNELLARVNHRAEDTYAAVFHRYKES